MEFDDVMQQRFNRDGCRISRFYFAGIYRDVLVYREELTDEVMDVLMNSDNYVYCFDRAQKMLTDDEINIIKGGGVIDVVKQLDIEMNDLGIEGESVVYFSGTDCHIDISYIREDVINLVHQIDRHNKLDNMIKENIEELERIVRYDIEPILEDIIAKNNGNVLNQSVFFVDVDNDHRTVTISLTLRCVFNAYKDWKNCRLPDHYSFRPTIRTGGEEFMGCIGDIISSGFSIKNMVRLDHNSHGTNNSVVLRLIFNRSDLRGKLIKFSKGVL